MGKSIGFLQIAFGADLRGLNRGLKKAQRSIARFGASMKKAGSNLARNITLPILGLGTIAVKTFMSFETSMLKVKAVSGATAKEFAELTKSAKLLGATTMFTAKQVSELQFELSKLGFSASEIDKAQASILSLSQATTHDLAESGKIVASTLKSFSKEAKDSAKITDIFAHAASSSAMDMEKFAAAMPTVGSTANTVGVSLEELTAQMMVLSDRGIEASTMGTHLRKIFAELAIKGLDYNTAMEAIANSTTPVVTATNLFGKRAFNTGIILANTTKEQKKFTHELQNSAGTAKKMADIMDSGSGGALRRLKSALEGVSIDLGQMLIPLFTRLMNLVQTGINFWKGLSEETRRTSVALALVASAIGPLLIVLGTLVSAFAFLLTPVGAAMAAITVGIVLAIKHYDSFKVILVDVINFFIDLYNESMIFKGVILAIGTSFSLVWNTIKFFAKDVIIVFKKIGEFGKNIFSSLGTIIKGVLTGSLSEVKDGAKKLSEALGNVFNSDKSKINALLFEKETKKIIDKAVDNFKSKEKIEFITTTDIDNAVNKASELAKKTLAKIKKVLLDSTSGTKEEKDVPTLLPIGDGDLTKFIGPLNIHLEKTISLMDILNDKFGISEEVLAGFGKQLKTSLIKGGEDFKEFAANAKAAIKETIGGLLALMVANAVEKAIASLPTFPGSVFLIPAIAGLAGGLAKTAFNSLIPAFADGGLVSGPTLSLIGEGAGTSISNPEVVAPLDKLKNYMNDGVNQTVEVFGRISGNDIFISNQRGGINRLRSV